MGFPWLTSVDFSGAASYSFHTDSNVITAWRPSKQLRGQDRPKMQTHGLWPRFTFVGGMEIHHEGYIAGTGADVNARIAAAVAEKDEMYAALFGELDTAPTDRKLGTLTVVEAGWPGSGVADVTILNIDHTLDGHEPLIRYMIDWLVFAPALLGGTTDAVHP